MDLAEGFELAAVLEREDPRDAFVSQRYATLSELPQGAIVGTSSLRRVVQLGALRPDLDVQPLRGNLDTRLRKLDEGQYAAIVLAAAGLKRLGLGGRIRALFEPEQMLPCAGQGALGIEVRSDAAPLRASLATLTHRPTWLAVHAERAVSRSLGGSCSMPLAAHALWRGEVLELRVALGHGQQPLAPLLRATVQAPIGDDEQARALGESAAAALHRAGAAAYLDALTHAAS
jgi:hydroxymethylbilane synthase